MKSLVTLVLFMLVCALAALWLMSWPAKADGNMACGPRDDVLHQLGDKYKEAPSAVGMAANGGLLELLESPDSSTWTVIISMPNGTSCLIAAGNDWQDTKPGGAPAIDPNSGPSI